MVLVEKICKFFDSWYPEDDFGCLEADSRMLIDDFDSDSDRSDVDVNGNISILSLRTNTSDRSEQKRTLDGAQNPNDVNAASTLKPSTKNPSITTADLLVDKVILPKKSNHQNANKNFITNYYEYFKIDLLVEKLRFEFLSGGLSLVLEVVLRVFCVVIPVVEEE